MDVLKITDGGQSINVNKGDAIRMELKLNKTEHKRTWIHIGDALFDFGSNKKDASNILTVTTEQFLFLEEMHNMLDYYRETK
jgi:hypothetical protein